MAGVPDRVWALNMYGLGRLGLGITYGIGV